MTLINQSWTQCDIFRISYIKSRHILYCLDNWESKEEENSKSIQTSKNQEQSSQVLHKQRARERDTMCLYKMWNLN